MIIQEDFESISGGNPKVETMALTLRNMEFIDTGLKATEISAISAMVAVSVWGIAFFENGTKIDQQVSYFDFQVGATGNIEAKCTHSVGPQYDTPFIYVINS